MKYHIIKASRAYDGYPYFGPSSDYEDSEADTLAEAIQWVDRLTLRNPVGWVVVEVETGRKLEIVGGEHLAPKL